MRGKGKQFVPAGGRVLLAFPGGAGYGPAEERSPELVKRDLSHGYISEQEAGEQYGYSEEQTQRRVLPPKPVQR